MLGWADYSQPDADADNFSYFGHNGGGGGGEGEAEGDGDVCDYNDDNLGWAAAQRPKPSA